ncbi:MAG TPA: hypothetical protein VFL91_23135 [Thermomicrobiales bacterium]|nr:hypothetical protein [Thermomicrobiales bacterium]
MQGRYTRLYADAEGESHFEEVATDLLPVDFAPPAPPLQVAALFPATGCSFVGAAPDWGGDVPHPAPRRQFFCTMRGEYAVTASDGTIRHFPAGRLLLLEDTAGKGHATRVIGEEDALIFAVTLDE